MESQNKYIRRRFKMWHGIVALLLLLFVVFRVHGSLKVKKQIENLRAKGYPVTLEELDRWYNIPDGASNAADAYLTAFSNYVEWDSEARKALPIVGRAPLPARTQPLDDPNHQLVEKFLSDNKKTLTSLHEAASIEHCRYPIDFTQEWDQTAPWLKELRASTRLLSLDVLIQCDNNNPQKALESIRTGLFLARSISTPLLIHRLVQIAVRAQTYRSIEKILNRSQLAEEQLKKLSSWIEESDVDEGYRRALIGEQCLGLHTFQSPLHDIVDKTESGKVFLLILAPRKILGLHDRETMDYISIMQDYINTVELPHHKRLTTSDSIEKTVVHSKRGGMLTRMLMPALGRIMQIDTRHLAHLRATQTAIAVERYRLTEGRLPQSLENLVPAYMEVVPTDPFDGQDLKFRTRETGFVVYSVGEDLTDEGGAERNSKKRDKKGKPLPWDVTFIVER
ncbi:MAG: hypothetical protein GY845_07565 [Planctomycetes bacterium]|nr:hypothetical protein [Planctomycetota bacterium]